MMLSAMLLCWGWSLHLLSRLCFCLAEAYVCLVESLILKPMGYTPISATKRDALFHKQRSQKQQPAQQLQPAKVADIQQLRCSVASLSHQVHKLQSCTGSPPPKQDNVQRWFQNHAAAYDAPRSSTSSVTLTTVQQPHTCRYSTACQQEQLDSSQPVACAAAAAAMALYGKQAGLSADAAAAAVGAAAVFAQRLSSSSEPGSSWQSSEPQQRLSSSCLVPPLEFDASDEEQRELEDMAPGEFLCPIGRVLMTDPVCTPSGFTYQRSFIEDFLIKTGHDPARDTPLNAAQLYPNIVMRDQIATWLQKHGVAT